MAIMLRKILYHERICNTLQMNTYDINNLSILYIAMYQV